MANTTLEVIKDVYRDLLTIDKDFYLENSIVAGGAIRDTLLNKPVKDIDIFVRCHKKGYTKITRGYTKITKDFSRYFLRQPTRRVNKISEDYDGEDEFTVYNIVGYALPVQMMFMHTPASNESILMDFPCSISRVAFVPKNNKILKSPTFDVSKLTKTCVWSSRWLESDAFRKSMVDKIKKKYSDYEHKVGA